MSRYDRQMLLDGWGEEGQRRLKTSTVFIAGAGGLGSPVAIHHAVAGVGSTLKGRLLVWDGSAMTFRTFPIAEDPNSPVCGQGAGHHV
jgi:molybdopterin/thiamine biosynthesis adenylyltransferase